MKTTIYFVALIWSVVGEMFTETERKEIVELHTQLRESVQPPASNMLMMRYSPELETLAEKWIVNCTSSLADPKTLDEHVAGVSTLVMRDG
uniref:SCP domain-containing protein n=1 Tax=Mesocestoides corti TaxID=53468 RepID=A0A5K3FTD6_MESCO